MAFTKAKIVMAGLAVTAVCIVAPQQLKAQVPEAQMDGVMGQSIEDETVYESKPDLDTLIEKNAPVFGNRTSLKKASSYSSAFLNASFTTAGDYTSATDYHKADYADDELVNGIDVSYWQADAALKKKYSKDKTKWTQTGLDWESIHGAGIDFAFVRVASRDTKDGSIYRDNCADSHIQGAVSNDINVGLYFFSQALNETDHHGPGGRGKQASDCGKTFQNKRDSGMSGICGYHYGSRIPGRRICILCVDQKLYQYGCFV